MKMKKLVAAATKARTTATGPSVEISRRDRLRTVGARCGRLVSRILTYALNVASPDGPKPAERADPFDEVWHRANVTEEQR
jgi:hypothetical protein